MWYCWTCSAGCTPDNYHVFADFANIRHEDSFNQFFEQCNPLNARPEHEATHMPFVVTVLERRLHRHEISQTVAWSDVNLVEKQIEDDPHCRLAVQFCMLNKPVLFVRLPIARLCLFVFAATFVTVKVPNIRITTLPCFLFLIGYCGSSIRGSQTWNHKYQTCFEVQTRSGAAK